MTAVAASGPQQAASMTPHGALGVLRSRCHQTGSLLLHFSLPHWLIFLLLCIGGGSHGSIRWWHHNTRRLANATSVGVATTQVNCYFSFLPHFFLCACCTVLFFLHHFSILRKFLFVHVQVPELGYQTHRLIVIFLAFCLTFFALAFLQFLQWCWESQCMPTAQVLIFAYLFPRYSGKGHIDKATKTPMMCLDTCIGGVSQAHVNCCFSFFLTFSGFSSIFFTGSKGIDVGSIMCAIQINCQFFSFFQHGGSHRQAGGRCVCKPW